MTEKVCLVCESNTNNRIKFCNCIVCDDCFKRYCKVLVDDGNFEISCAARNCRTILPYHYVVQYLSEESVVRLDKLITRAGLIDQEKNKIKCPSCSQVCELHEDAKNFFCDDCSETYCARCYEKEHNFDELCEYDQVEDSLEQEGVNVKRCPRCRISIEKYDGCDCVRCPNCKCKFCWSCLMNSLGQNNIQNYSD